MSTSIAGVGGLLLKAYQAKGKAVFFGNGGSAADAQHLAAEFLGRFNYDRPPLPALALNVNTSTLTAIGNDYSYDEIFRRQLQALGQPGDVAIGISTSGNSRNVLTAMEWAKANGLLTVALTGQKGGKLRELAEHCICVPSEETPRIQECHILIGHIWCEIVESGLYPR